MPELEQVVEVAQLAKKATKPRKKATKKKSSAAKKASQALAAQPRRKRPLKGVVSPTSAQNVRAREQANKALELRKAGLNFSRIAEQLGYYDATGARKAVDRVLKDTADELAPGVRSLELARLDAIWERQYLKAVQGDRLAVDRCLRIMERRAAYLGLDAPIRIQQMVITEEQLDEAIERIEAEASALEARSYAEGEGDRPEWMDEPIEAEVVDDEDD